MTVQSKINAALSPSRAALRALLFGLAVAAAPALTGCATFSGSKSAAPDGARVAAFPSVNERDLVEMSSRRGLFRTGDKAIVDVYNVENLSGIYPVNPSGNIVVPLVGSVPASGRSVQQLQADLVSLYGESYLQNPSINVDREAAELGRIVVDGAVRKPGVFDITELVGLSEAIAMAEGITEDADPSDVYVIREIDGERKVHVVDLKAVRFAQAADPRLAPGDIVFVEDSGSRVLFREFLRTVPLISTILIYGTR